MKPKVRRAIIFVTIVCLTLFLMIWLHEAAHVLIFRYYGVNAKMHFFTLEAFRNKAIAYVEPVNEDEIWNLMKNDYEAFLHMNFLHALNELLTIYLLIPFSLFLSYSFFSFFEDLFKENEENK